MKNSKKQQKENQKDSSLNEINLTAIIVADTFSNLLNPINNNISDILIPVCNIPVIEYMIDFLTTNSVKEIFILSKNNYDSLSAYLKRNHKKTKSIKLINCEEANGFGDCLRKLNSKKVIDEKLDIILIKSLVIANFDLEKIYKVHLENKKKDKNCIMTSVLKTYKNQINFLTNYDKNILIHDKKTNQILQYENLMDLNRITINENLKFKINNKIENATANTYCIRSDLFDSGIDICSAEVLERFGENFDFNSLRDDFYKATICNEIYQDTFYLHELTENDYVGLIKNFDNYKRITNEIIHRWAYPVTLNKVFISNKLNINFKAIEYNYFVDGSINVSTKSKFSDGIVIGSDCLVEEDCVVQNSVIGKNCKIGKSCIIKNSILFDNCVIYDNSVIINSILSSWTKISDGLEVINCFLGDNVEMTKENSESYYEIKEDNNLVIEDYRIKKEENNVSNNEDYITESSNEEKTSQDSIIINNGSNLNFTKNENFLMDLDDKDLNLINLIKENIEEDDDEYASSEEEEEESEENFEDELRIIIEPGLKAHADIDNVITEIISLKKAFWEQTFADSKF